MTRGSVLRLTAPYDRLMTTEEASTAGDCLFCRIVAREVPAEIVHETATTLTFRDLQPQAPTHVLVIPKEHQPTVVALGAASPQALVELIEAVGAVAAQEGLDAGYRTLFNTGALAQQSVFHAHVHVLGGRAMTWPPG
jgi:histidine triad (HIT) family protein